MFFPSMHSFIYLFIHSRQNDNIRYCEKLQILGTSSKMSFLTLLPPHTLVTVRPVTNMVLRACPEPQSWKMPRRSVGLSTTAGSTLRGGWKRGGGWKKASKMCWVVTRQELLLVSSLLLSLCTPHCSGHLAYQRTITLCRKLRLSNFTKASQQISDRVKIWTQVCLSLKVCIFPPHYIISEGSNNFPLWFSLAL